MKRRKITRYAWYPKKVQGGWVWMRSYNVVQRFIFLKADWWIGIKDYDYKWIDIAEIKEN